MNYSLSILSIVLFTSITAGCSSVPENTTEHSATDREKIAQCKLQIPDQDRVKKEAVSSGCILGLAAWKAIGQNNPASLICMAGGGAGFLLGDSIAERKCHYITLEEQLDGEIAHASSMNSKFSIYLLQSKKDLALSQLQVDALVAQQKTGKANAVQQTTLKQTLSKQLEKERLTMKQVQAEYRFKQETQKQARQSQDKANKLLAEIRMLQTNIHQLRETEAKLQENIELL